VRERDSKALARREQSVTPTTNLAAPSVWRRALGTLVLFGTVGLSACQTLFAATQ